MTERGVDESCQFEFSYFKDEDRGRAKNNAHFRNVYLYRHTRLILTNPLVTALVGVDRALASYVSPEEPPE